MTYRAVVKNGAAVLPADAQIADGTEVEVVVSSRGTPLRELLRYSGKWHGDDADEVLEMIYRTRSSRPLLTLE